MDKILASLKSITKESKPVLIGMGNDINADDGIAPYIIRELGELKFFITLDVGTLPENFTKKIAEMHPSHIIILDAAMIDGEPGTINLVNPDAVDEVIFTTHHIPLSYTIQRLKAMCGAEVIIIGIKPKMLDTGMPMTPAVIEAGDKVVRLFSELDKKLNTLPDL